MIEKVDERGRNDDARSEVLSGEEDVGEQRLGHEGGGDERKEDSNGG